MKLVLAAGGCDGGTATGDALETRAAPLVYGADDRLELCDLDAAGALARFGGTSLLAIGPARELTIGGVGTDAPVGVTSPSAQERLGLCPGERFAGEPSFALCSAFAVAPHLALTAAHCLDVLPPGELAAVMGFCEATASGLAPITASQVHAIVEVVASNPWRDYALVRLDGAPLEPATLAAKMPTWGSPVSSVNHGMGVPAKADLGGHAFPLDSRRFTADLDAFGGASGAPVLDEAGHVVGILTSGSADFDEAPTGCHVVHQTSDGSLAANELVEHARAAIDDLCARRPDPALCAGAEPVSAAAGCAVAAQTAAQAPWPGALAVAALLIIRGRTRARRRSPKT